jgi:hypothetical protein
VKIKKSGEKRQRLAGFEIFYGVQTGITNPAGLSRPFEALKNKS